MNDKTLDGSARRVALDLLSHSEHEPTSVVDYRSDGFVLIHGTVVPNEALVEAIQQAGLKCAALVSSENARDVSLKEGPGKIDCVVGTVVACTGHLGSFHVAVSSAGEEIEASDLMGRKGRGFDLVLDVAEDPLITSPIPPLGYFAKTDQEDISRIIEQMSEMVGEFEKPKYFNLDPNICAHKSRGVDGCTKCLDVCPTLAIIPSEESIEVDPYLCQGIGVCTTVCPTGAITYAFPRVNDQLDDIRRVLHRYHDEGGTDPVLLFHDDEKGKEWIQHVAESLRENFIPFEVENVASLGMDTWLSCLAYGSRHVLLLATDQLTDEIVSAMEREIEVGHRIVEAMGYERGRIQIVRPATPGEITNQLPDVIGSQLVSPAGFAGFNEKRTTIHLAIQHFQEHAPNARKSVSLEIGSPFGRVKVDRKACTLCMSCAAVCPAGAITGGDGLPKLMFLEKNCVQCGMCETACPEDAITLEARFNFEAQERDQAQVLHEEEPFNCVKCGKPFSTQSMMSKIREKLEGHWMYQDEAQVRRLEMCDNCRIEDMYVNSGGLDPYEKPKPTGSKV